MHLWALTDAGGWVALRSFLMLIHHTAVQTQPALSTLCTSVDMQHFFFFFFLEFLVPLSSRWLFPYNNTTRSFSRRDSAPAGSLCTAQEEADICSCRLRSDWPQSVSGAWVNTGKNTDRNTSYNQMESNWGSRAGWKFLGDLGEFANLCWDIPGISSEITRGGVQGTKPQKLA